MPLGVNKARGEASVTIAGEPVRLCLTLGALAEIEAALGVGDDESLAARLSRAKMGDIAALLEALLRGGGHAPDDAACLARAATPREAADAVVIGFAAAAQD